WTLCGIQTVEPLCQLLRIHPHQGSVHINCHRWLWQLFSVRCERYYQWGARPHQ
ncbi:hypothetical protein NDU88_005770, partial [Pleurodeles waltl]